MIKPGLYRHFKGALYKVIDVARHSESGEALVLYQALYGDKKIWARPLSMFMERLEHEGKAVQRFRYCLNQSLVLEVAVLDVIPGQQQGFEAAFAQAESIVTQSEGYITHRLERCIELDNRYILLVEWQSLEHHATGFRQSREYQNWRSSLHHYYEPMPTALHFQKLSLFAKSVTVAKSV